MPYRYLVLVPIEQCLVGTCYPHGTPLPLHCTVMHWFEPGKKFDLRAVDQFLDRWAMELAQKAIVLESKEPALFGPDDDVPVHVLAHNEKLLGLHYELYCLLEEMESLPKETRWIGVGYRPHVTDPAGKFPPGSQALARRLTLIRQDTADRAKTAAKDYFVPGFVADLAAFQ